MPRHVDAWDASVARFKSDLQSLKDLVLGSTIDLLAPIPHGEGQTLLREALLVADHNAYHLGQLVLLGKMLDASTEGSARSRKGHYSGTDPV